MHAKAVQFPRHLHRRYWCRWQLLRLRRAGKHRRQRNDEQRICSQVRGPRNSSGLREPALRLQQPNDAAQPPADGAQDLADSQLLHAAAESAGARVPPRARAILLTLAARDPLTVRRQDGGTDVPRDASPLHPSQSCRHPPRDERADARPKPQLSSRSPRRRAVPEHLVYDH